MLGLVRIDERFIGAVHEVVAELPAGEVVTYGEIAAEIGHPGQARAVGRVLGDSDGRLPWWRVVAADGRLAPGHEREQRRRLESEGVSTDAHRVLGMRRRRRDGGAGGTPH